MRNLELMSEFLRLNQTLLAAAFMVFTVQPEVPVAQWLLAGGAFAMM